MAKPKPKFKKGDAFFCQKDATFVLIDSMDYYPDKGGWLYNLKCYKHEQDEAKPWKRYYESRIINELAPLKTSNAVKTLFGK